MSWESYWNNVGAYWTGRNGVYEDEAKVEAAISALDAVRTKIDETLNTPIRQAIVDLNAVTGFTEYVGTLNQGAFETLTNEANTGIDAMIAQIQAKKDDIDEYNKGSVLDHVIGTGSMVVGKIGEGFVSVFEGIGDAGLTAANWVGSGVYALATGEDFSTVLNSEDNFLKNAIEYDVSGTLMKPLTENEWAAKYSAITADSGAASVCKGVGKAIGYVTLGGAVGGWAEGVSATSRLSGAANLLSNSTNAVTAVTTVSAFGQGTETGLRAGKTFEGATVQGLEQAAVEGSMAYAGGKIGEHATIKASNAEIKSTLDQEVARVTSQYADDVAALDKELASGAITDAEYAAAKASLDSSRQTAINLAEETAATNKGIVETVVKGQGGYSGNSLYQAGENLVQNPGQTIAGVRTSAGNVLKTATNAVTHPIKTTKDAVTTVANAARHPIDNIAKPAYEATRNAVETAVSPANIGVTTLAGGEAVLGAGSNALDYTADTTFNSDRVNGDLETKEDVQQKIKDIDTETKRPGVKPVESEELFKQNQTTPKPDPDPHGGDGTGDGNGTPSGGTETSPGSSGVQGKYTDPESTTNTATNKPTNDATEPNTAANIVFSNNNASNTASNTNTSSETNIPVVPNTSNNGTNSDNPTPGATVPTGGTSHTGGGYTGGAYTADDTSVTEDPLVDADSIIEPEEDDITDSIESIITGGSNFTKLPTSNSAINSGTSGSAVIPVIAGLSAAAAAGIGAKAYMDRKANNDNGEDDFETDEWTGEEDLDMDYNDGVQQEQYLDDDGEYGMEETTEKYGARNNDELADMQ